MKQRRFARTGVDLPIVGQGTWNMELDARAEAITALRRGMELGMTHIDTAELYGSGRVEELVGEAIRGRRDEVYLVSKVVPENASRQGTLAACERSLRRLGTDRLDLYLLHWPGRYPLAETFEAFEQLRQNGKIVAFGVSNFDETELAEAMSIVGPKNLTCNQVLYHLKERAIEHQVIPFCEKHGIAVVGYSPFGSGDFPSPRSSGGRLLDEIAVTHRASARQIALAFLTRQEPLFTIPKASSTRHVEDNRRGGEFELTDDEIRRIDEAFPRGRPQRGVPML